MAVIGGGSLSRNALARAVENQQVSKILILDGGVGYSSAAVAITGFNKLCSVATATILIGNGVISQTTVTALGSGYKTKQLLLTITGDGYA